jgi:vacuolar protein sorting-associated protein 54
MAPSSRKPEQRSTRRHGNRGKNNGVGASANTNNASRSYSRISPAAEDDNNNDDNVHVHDDNHGDNNGDDADYFNGAPPPVTPPQNSSRALNMKKSVSGTTATGGGSKRYNMVRSSSGETSGNSSSRENNPNANGSSSHSHAAPQGGRTNMTMNGHSTSGRNNNIKASKKPSRRGYDHVVSSTSTNQTTQHTTLSPLTSQHTRQSSIFSLSLTPQQPPSRRQILMGGGKTNSPLLSGNSASRSVITRPGQYYSSGGFVGAGSGVSGMLPGQQAGSELHPATQAYYQHQLASFNLLEPVLNPYQDHPHDIWTTIWNSELLGGEGELEEYDPDAYQDSSDNPIAELEKYVTDLSTNMSGWMSTWTGGVAGTAIAASPSHHQSQQQNHELTPRELTSHSQHHQMTAASGHGAYYDAANLPDFLAKLDLSDFHRFMGRTGPFATKFVRRGEQLSQFQLPEEEDEDDDDYDEDNSVDENEDEEQEEGSGNSHEVGDEGDKEEQAIVRELPFLPSIDHDADSTDKQTDKAAVAAQESSPMPMNGDSPVADDDDDDDDRKPAALEADQDQANAEEHGNDTAFKAPKKKRKKQSNKSRTIITVVKTPEERLRAKLLNKNNYPMMIECEVLVPPMFFQESYDLSRPLNFEHLIEHLENEAGGMELMFPLDDKERKLRLDKKVRKREDRKKQRQLRKAARRKARREEEEKEDRSEENGGENGELQQQQQQQQRGETTEEESTPRKKKGEKKKKEKKKELTPEERQKKLAERRQHKQVLQADQMALLSSYLDSVELSLLEQVRSKSQAYFTETSRFAELKTLVKDGCDQVVFLKSVLVELQLCNVEDVERIPRDASAREALENLCYLLELCDNVAMTKASVAGLLSMNDTRGAIAAIRGSRVLLSPPKTTSDKRAQQQQQQQLQQQYHVRQSHEHTYVLGNLRALSGVNQQLGEYEGIVVESLSTTLVDIFLSWESSDSSTSLFDSFGLSSTDLMMSTTLSTSTANAMEQNKQARNLIESLGLCHKLSQTHILYVNKLCEVLKVTVKTTVQECAADAKHLNSGKNSSSSSLASNNDKQSSQSQSSQPTKQSGLTASVSNMTFEQFMDCLDMLFEQLLSRLRSALAVSKFLRQEGIVLRDDIDGGGTGTTGESGHSSGSSTALSSADPSGGANTASAALTTASELAHKSISELLRLKKDAHSLLSLVDMQRLWDSCLTYTIQLEKMSGCKAYGLRSTLLAQTKAFVERQHQSHMTSLVAALDSEKWTQCHVSEERQASLTRLCTGRAVLGSSAAMLATQQLESAAKKEQAGEASTSGTLTPSKSSNKREVNDAEVEGTHYKLVWSCLLLVEMVMKDISCAAHFQTLATSMVGKIVELLRLFNTRSTQLVLGAGAIHSSAKLKSITVKHLALVTQCLGMMISLLPHIYAALMAQLPAKQHMLLTDLDKIKHDYADHSEKVLTKFVNILSGIVERGLAPRIDNAASQHNFDQRATSLPAGEPPQPDAAPLLPLCPFLEGVQTNTRKIHGVLKMLLPPDHLVDVFARIFLYLDQKIPVLFRMASQSQAPVLAEGGKVRATFEYPLTEEGKQRMVEEIRQVTDTLNQLPGVSKWDFTVMTQLERELGLTRVVEEVEPEPEEEEESQTGVEEEQTPSDSTVDETVETANGESNVDGTSAPVNVMTAKGESNVDDTSTPVNVITAKGESNVDDTSTPVNVITATENGESPTTNAEDMQDAEAATSEGANEPESASTNLTGNGETASTSPTETTTTTT